MTRETRFVVVILRSSQNILNCNCGCRCEPTDTSDVGVNIGGMSPTEEVDLKNMLHAPSPCASIRVVGSRECSGKGTIHLNLTTNCTGRSHGMTHQTTLLVPIRQKTFARARARAPACTHACTRKRRPPPTCSDWRPTNRKIEQCCKITPMFTWQGLSDILNLGRRNIYRDQWQTCWYSTATTMTMPQHLHLHAWTWQQT